MRKNTGGGYSRHDKCLPIPACDVADSTSSFCEATQFPGAGVTEETVVLGDFLIQTLVEGDIKLPSDATDIKHIKKNVYLTQCKALPIPGVNDFVKLFIEGYIHKNIQYVEDCDGCVKDYSVDVPFSCFKRVELARPVVFPFGEFSVKDNVLQRRELAKDGMGADRCTFGSLTFEINNEPITCKLLASAVNEWDILQNFDKWGRFDKVTEKADVILAIKLTQKQACRVLAYVTNSGGDPADDTVSVISTATNTEIARIPVGDNPLGIAITPDGSRAYVTNSFDNTVLVINTATNTVIGDPIPVGDFPFGIAITPDGTRAYVTNLIDDTVTVINIATNTVIGDPIPVGNDPVAIAITPDGTRAYVTNSFSDNVSVINIATNTEILPRIPVEELPIVIAITPDGSRAYVTTGFGDGSGDTVSVINTATNTVIGDPIPVGDGPRGIAITPDGSRAYVTNLFDNNVSVINTATNTVIGDPIPVGNGPIRIAITPDGTRAYVTNLFDNNVSVINTATNTEILPRIPVGDFPFAIAIAQNCF